MGHDTPDLLLAAGRYSRRQERVHALRDISINLRYGEFTIAPATLLERSTMPKVIAPAWRPDRYRRHIPD
ncbi:MAG: hypothetical protein ACM3NI_08825 [Bacteroidota bacterium]